MSTHRTAVVLLGALVVAGSLCRDAAALEKQPHPGGAVQTGPIYLRQGPDLKIVKLWQTRVYPQDADYQTAAPLAAPVRVGQRTVFICDLVNLGPAATSPWRIDFFVDGAAIWNNTVSSLAVNETKRGTGFYTPQTAGTHTVRCTLDPKDVLKDRDLSNNEASLTFTVLPKITKKAPVGGTLRRVGQ